jgi:ergosteryl-3beta-O-L-aspartate synthase
MSVLRKFSKSLHHGHGEGETDSNGTKSPVSPHSPHSTHSMSPHGPRKSIAAFLKSESNQSWSSDEYNSDDSSEMSKNAIKRLHKKELKEARHRLSEDIAVDSEARRKERENRASIEESSEMRTRYGDTPLVQSQEWTHQERAKFETFSPEKIGEDVIFRARIHHIRRMGPKLIFVIFRQQIMTMQGVVGEEQGKVSTFMVQWAERIRIGSVVLVKGVLQKPNVPITGTTLSNVELHVRELHCIVRRAEPIPFSVFEAELSKVDDKNEDGRRTHISDRTRLANRIIDLRTATSQAIFRVQSGVSNLFRNALDSRGFTEIHSPKLQGGGTESGSSVFQINYFGRPAFLAQSPQLSKQMCIAADFEKVYEVGAIFRAENSQTHRHLTEYTGLDIEMAIEEHYHEALLTVDATIKSIFEGLYTRYRREIDVIKNQFPHEDLVWLEQTPIIPFQDGIQLLIDSGYVDEEGNPPSKHEDMATRDEIRLGELIKEKYKTDYYILDKFPVSARPFYTMPDPTDDKFTNSFDIFVRGQEIVSGGQRIHESKMLEENMKVFGVDPSTMEEYMEGFRWGAPPHAGAGIGLERLVMLILKLGNIRLASLFHRDPKSFPAKPVEVKLPHPDDNTLTPPWTKKDASPDEKKLQLLENLIANYGDATNTNWTDDKYLIWRHEGTGAAVSYVPSHGHAIIPGNPLCDASQYTKIIIVFLQWLKREKKLKPIWILASTDIEEILGVKLGWKTLSCTAEERVDPTKNAAESDPDVARKVRHAQNEGVKIIDLPEDKPVPQEIMDKVDVRVKEWLNNRHGTQVHLSEIKPWRDMVHRRYFYATDKEGTICAIVVLARLSPEHGLQAKYCLDFPGAPSGTIEYITIHALQAAAKSGIKSMTFGGGATAHLTPGHHLTGAKVKMLQHAYSAIVNQMHLTRKSEFRQKLGAVEGESLSIPPSPPSPFFY